MTETCSMSTTVGVPNGTVLLLREVASNVILAGTTNLGGVVWTTFTF